MSAAVDEKEADRRSSDATASEDVAKALGYGLAAISSAVLAAGKHIAEATDRPPR